MNLLGFLLHLSLALLSYKGRYWYNAEKEKQIDQLEKELIKLKAEPIEATIVEHDPSMKAVRVRTTISDAVAIVHLNGEIFFLKDIWLPDWLFQGGFLKR